jgi:hypothetical protein
MQVRKSDPQRFYQTSQRGSHAKMGASELLCGSNSVVTEQDCGDSFVLTLFRTRQISHQAIVGPTIEYALRLRI